MIFVCVPPKGRGCLRGMNESNWVYSWRYWLASFRRPQGFLLSSRWQERISLSLQLTVLAY